MVGLVHNISDVKINSNYNTPQEVEAFDGILTLDGIYYNVYLNQSVLEGKQTILFVMGDYVGGNNEFDTGQPRERYCDWNEIMDLVNIYGCKLGWHTRSHRDLTKLTNEEIIYECMPPLPMDYFAYPYSKYNDKVIEIVKALGYKEAYTVNETDGTQWTIPRQYINPV